MDSKASRGRPLIREEEVEAGDHTLGGNAKVFKTQMHGGIKRPRRSAKRNCDA